MDQIIKVTMTRQEAIKYYANKIIEDSIEDCSEFNYCMTIEHYEDDGFVKQNQEAILKEIKNDERVADCYINKSSQPYTFDMVFWTDYCPGYYDEYDLSISVQSKVLRKFIDQLITIKNNVLFEYSTTTRETINNFLIKNDFRFPLSVKEQEASNNMLKKFITETKFFNKYLDKDKIIINKENVKELIVELQEKCNKLEIYKKDYISMITKQDVDKMLDIFEKDKIYPDRYIGVFMCKDENVYLAIDNRDGEMYIDEYKTEDECTKVLFRKIHGYEEEEEEENEPI